MSPPQTAAILDRLSECLLRLGRLARETPAPEFLGLAVEIVREWIYFPRGWWGMGTDNGKDQAPPIHQSETIGLPDDFASEWRKIALLDSFSDDIRSQIGQVQRYSGADDGELPAAIREFDRRYDLHYTMGVALDDAATGHGFFIVLYRGQDDAAFSDEEAALFLHLMRHIVQLWHYSLQDALATASKEDIAHAALARIDGRVLYAGPKLCELLYTEWPAWDGIGLPAAVVARFAALPCKLRLAGGVIDLSNRDEHVWLLRSRAGSDTPQLSPREHRVAQLFASGHSYKEIARLLGLTPATVRTYLRDAYLRLGVRNKVQLGGALSGRTTP
ncbi:MAG: helix-turn-helix transcriptional regulator [Burkholderiales bacterium]|nr:helix-turn-helix transcriptional regulator [Burkholderiales bacterium]